VPRGMSRRELIDRALRATVLTAPLALIGEHARAAGLKALDESDPTAKALGFVSDGSRLDPAANPPFKAGARCANCTQFQGKATEATAGCGIFAGRSVPAGGWCVAWTRRAE